VWLGTVTRNNTSDDTRETETTAPRAKTPCRRANRLDKSAASWRRRGPADSCFSTHRRSHSHARSFLPPPPRSVCRARRPPTENPTNGHARASHTVRSASVLFDTTRAVVIVSFPLLSSSVPHCRVTTPFYRTHVEITRWTRTFASDTRATSGCPQNVIWSRPAPHDFNVYGYSIKIKINRYINLSFSCWWMCSI